MSLPGLFFSSYLYSSFFSIPSSSSFLPPPTRFLAVLGSRPPCLTSRLMCVCKRVYFLSLFSVCARTRLCACVSSSGLDVVSSPVFVFLLRPADLFSQECYCYCHTVNTHSLFLCSSPIFSPRLSLHPVYFSFSLSTHICHLSQFFLLFSAHFIFPCLLCFLKHIP